MRFARNIARRPLEMNMTPMIDVVFLLLIFFMTVSQVAEANREALELTKAAGSVDPGRSEMIVNIARDGIMRASGESLTLAALETRCREANADTVESTRTHVSVVLRIDRLTQCKRVNEAVTALRKAGVRNVRFAVAGVE